MHFARKGEITEEILFVAERENLPESLVMEEVARGRKARPLGSPPLDRMGNRRRPASPS